MTERRRQPDDGTADAPLDETAQRLLNLLFIFNAAERPLTTDEIVSDADLGYGSPNRASDLRKFRRDREKLAERGVFIAEVRATDAAETEQSSWAIDRARTFAGGGHSARGRRAPLGQGHRRLSRRPARTRSPRRSTPCASARARSSPVSQANSRPKTPSASRPLPPRNKTVRAKTARPTPSGRLSRSAVPYPLRTATRAVRAPSAPWPSTASLPTAPQATSWGSTARRRQCAPFVSTASNEWACSAIPTRSPPTLTCAPIFLPFDLGEGEPVAATFSLPAERTCAELMALTYGRGTSVRAGDGSWRWHITVRDLGAAAAFALEHARDGMRPVAPAALVDTWRDNHLQGGERPCLGRAPRAAKASSPAPTLR